MNTKNWRSKLKEIMVMKLVKATGDDLYSGQIITPVEDFISNLIEQVREEERTACKTVMEYRINNNLK